MISHPWNGNIQVLVFEMIIDSYEKSVLGKPSNQGMHSISKENQNEKLQTV